MKKLFQLSLVLFCLSFFIACDEDSETVPPGEFDEGILVVNEGSFGSDNGSISLIGADGTVSNGLFSQRNNDAILGDVVQSAYRADDKFFVIVNNSNKIEVVSDEDFASLYSKEDLSLPRYMTSEGQTGYVTEWVSFNDEGRVTAFDLNSGVTSFSVNTGFGAEDVIRVDDKLYVSNNFESSIAVVDLATESLQEKIQVGSSPSKIINRRDKLFIICNGGTDPDFNPLNDGLLVTYDLSTSVVDTVSTFGRNISGKIGYDVSRGNLYLYAGKDIYKIDLDNPAENPQPLFTADEVANVYGIGVFQNENIYVGDAKSFAAAGQVFAYDPSGNLLATYDVGIAPNQFLFLVQ